MNPQEELNQLNGVIDRVVDLIGNMVASGKEIPDDIASQLAQELNFAAERITQLQGELAEIATGGVPGVPSGAELLWILSGENPDVFRQYLQTFPDPELNALATNPTKLNQVISDLSQKVTIPAGEVSPEGVAKAQLQSSNVYGFKYNPKSKKLLVQFQGNEQPGQGPVYKYDNVPPVIFKIFASGAVPAKTSGSNKWGRWWKGKNPSLGAAMYQLIKLGGFPYQRVA